MSCDEREPPPKDPSTKTTKKRDRTRRSIPLVEPAWTLVHETHFNVQRSPKTELRKDVDRVEEKNEDGVNSYILL
jgi:hypothetical protein